MAQADFGIIGDLFAVIKSAAEHGTQFPQIVAAARTKLLEIEKNLNDAAAAEKKKLADDAAAQVATSSSPVISGRSGYVPGESEARADSTSDQQPSLLDRRA